MKIKTPKDYKIALKALKEYEDQFDVTRGKDCYILVSDKSKETPLVLTDEHMAARIARINDRNILNGTLVGPTMKSEDVNDYLEDNLKSSQKDIMDSADRKVWISDVKKVVNNLINQE